MVQIGRRHEIFRTHEQQIYTVINRLSTVKHGSFSNMHGAIDVTEENVAWLQAVPLLFTFAQLGIANFF